MSPEASERLNFWYKYLGDNLSQEKYEWSKWEQKIDPPNENVNEKESKEE
jgi:hypothetical protein